MSENESPMENLKDAILDDDKKLGEEVPGAPFAVVGRSYIAILLVALAGFGLYLWLR